MSFAQAGIGVFLSALRLSWSLGGMKLSQGLGTCPGLFYPHQAW